MNQFIIKAFLATQYYRVKKQEQPGLSNLQILYEFERHYSNKSLKLISDTGITREEIFRRAGSLAQGVIDTIFHTRDYLANRFILELNRNITAINKASHNVMLDKQAVEDILKAIEFMHDKCTKFNSFKSEVIKYTIEVVLLRTGLATDKKEYNYALSILKPLFEKYAVDKALLFVLAGDASFKIQAIADKHKLSLWSKVKQDTIAEISNASLLKKLAERPDLQFYLLKKINYETITGDALRQIMHYLEKTTTPNSFYNDIDSLIEENPEFFSFQRQVSAEARGDTLRALTLDTVKKIETEIKPDKMSVEKWQQEKRKRYFAKRLVEDNCPVTISPFISFCSEDEGIVQLAHYQDVTYKTLDKKLGASDLGDGCYQVYDRPTFASWLKQPDCQTDMINRQVKCKIIETVYGKYNQSWFRFFLNMKRLQQTGLINYISDDWFKYNKLGCLMNLHPELLEPKWFCYIENLNIQELTEAKIKLINIHFRVRGTLPKSAIEQLNYDSAKIEAIVAVNSVLSKEVTDILDEQLKEVGKHSDAELKVLSSKEPEHAGQAGQKKSQELQERVCGLVF